jgi:hypothetical protein
MERVAQPFVGRCCWVDLTWMTLSDPPCDGILVGSRIGRRLTHATLSRKRSEGDELLEAVEAVLVIAVTCHAPCARGKG